MSPGEQRDELPAAAESCLSSLSCVSLNVNGSLERKLKCIDFVNKLNLYDIIVLSETWSNKHSQLKLDGYEIVPKHRKRRKGARRDSGGIICYFRKEIWGGITCLPWNFEDGLLFKLDKQFFGLLENIFLICPYMRPSSSSRNILITEIDIFESISDKLSQLCNKGDIILIGDMNARTGNLIDIEPYNDDEINENSIDIEIGNITSNDLDQNGMLPLRCSEDKGYNAYGKRLIELCKMSNMVILNGRTGSDKGIGKFTFTNHRGTSVNDYVVCTKNVLNIIDDFCVSDPIVFSDHSLISVKIKCKKPSLNTIDEEAIGYSDVKMSWKEEMKDEFCNEMNTVHSFNAMSTVLTILENEVINQNVINSCVDKIQEVVINAAHSHKIKTRRNDVKDKIIKDSNGWYDADCKTKLIQFKAAEREFRITRGDNERLTMCEARKSYRKCCRIKCRQFQMNKADELAKLSKNNPGLFWKKVKKGKKIDKNSCNFYDYFKELNNVDHTVSDCVQTKIENWESSEVCVSDETLDSEITMKELEHAIGKLKRNKANGLDNILNEFLIFGGTQLKIVLLKLFNKILETGLFPSVWASGEIIPIFKSGDPNIPSNYRGITLVSCLAKLFTNIINLRLNEWAEANDVYCETQFGFRNQRSTSDCLFVLHGLIQHFISTGSPFYCAFIDLKRAFDSTNRRALWLKLHESKVSNKIINLIKNMYLQIKLCVKNNYSNIDNSGNSMHNIDAFFCSKAGVFQGESLSPFLFSMFINDINDHLSTEDAGIKIEQTLMTIILFADDMAVFSLSAMGLQNGLDRLKEYCFMWGLTVNTLKTKCVAFRKGGKITKQDKWKYDGNDIETVNQFKYLGFVLASSGSLNKGIDALLSQSQRALFNLKSIFHQNQEMKINTKLYLFNTLVVPILTYACEVWGFCKAEQMDRMYLGFLKYLACVRKTVPTAYIYNEFGVFPLSLLRKIRIIKFWLKILNMNDTHPVKLIYNLLLRDSNQNAKVKNWVTLLKEMLEINGFGNVWSDQGVPSAKIFLIDFEQRCKDIFIQNNNAEIYNSSEHRLYRYLSHEHGLAWYLNNIKEKYIRVALTKLRLGSHNFLIERGRWGRVKIDFFDRRCDECDEVEDEYHIVLKCPRFNDLRKNLISNSMVRRPSMYMFVKLLNSKDLRELRKLGIFFHKALNYYDSLVL